MRQDNNINPKSVIESKKQNFRNFYFKRLLNKIQKIYIQHPRLNLSLLTGIKYPIIPRLSGNFFTGRLPHFFTGDGVFKNLTEAGKLATAHPTGMSYYWIVNQTVLLVTNPEHIKQVFVTNATNVSRRTAARFMELFWGPSITTDPHKLWKEKRAIYSNHLAKTKVLQDHEPTMRKVVDKYIQQLTNNPNTAIKLEDFLSDFTLEMVMTLVAPHDDKRDITKLSDYTRFVGDYVANLKNVFMWTLPVFMRKFLFGNKNNNPEEVKTKMKANFNEFLLKPNADYIKSTDNFLRTIWELRKAEPGQAELEKNVDVFGDGNALFFAAQDNVASAFEFSIKLLCAHPHVENKLHEELRRYLHDQEFNMENINKAEYLEMVIKEVLRLYPPTILPRGVDKTFMIGDIPVSKGDLIIVSPYITHRLKSLWEEPEQFKPERFSQENIDKIPQHAYIPFGEGQHACVGWRFAFQQLKLLLAAVYLNYHVEIENNDFEVTIRRTTIRPKDHTVARFIPVI